MSRITVYDPRTGERIMDESGAATPPPVMPSIGDTQGIRVNNTLAEHGRMTSELALALNCLDAALEIIGGGMSLESFRTDNRKPATITRVENKYEVRRRA